MLNEIKAKSASKQNGIEDAVKRNTRLITVNCHHINQKPTLRYLFIFTPKKTKKKPWVINNNNKNRNPAAICFNLGLERRRSVQGGRGRGQGGDGGVILHEGRSRSHLSKYRSPTFTCFVTNHRKASLPICHLGGLPGGVPLTQRPAGRHASPSPAQWGQ